MATVVTLAPTVQIVTIDTPAISGVVVEATRTVSVTGATINIVSAGIQGPPGPAGPPGDTAGHEVAADPHPGYQKESEKGAASGYAGLGANSLVPAAQLGTGTPDGTKFLRDDQVYAVPPGDPADSYATRVKWGVFV